MNSNSPSFSDKTSKIAEYLVECAEKGDGVQSYGDVCKAMKKLHGHKHSPRGLFKYLDAINKESSKRPACVLISVLVVTRNNRFEGKNLPGKGFFKVWAELNPEDKKKCYRFFIKGCDRVYKAARERKLDSLLMVKNFHN